VRPSRCCWEAGGLRHDRAHVPIMPARPPAVPDQMTWATGRVDGAAARCGETVGGVG
jgi:hypothetical protein